MMNSVSIYIHFLLLISLAIKAHGALSSMDDHLLGTPFSPTHTINHFAVNYQNGGRKYTYVGAENR